MRGSVRADGLALVRAGRTVAEGLSFAVEPGERLAVLGPNGSGKTTLARTLLGFSAYRGFLKVDGLEVRSDPAAARRALAAVFSDADPQLLMPTVHDELAFALKAADEPADPSRVRALASDFGLVSLLSRHPSRLSSGEKRRTLLALSIGRRPTVLVLDEPTADLDARGTGALGRTLKALPQTIILISHDYDLTRSLCRRAVVLAGGRAAVFEDIEALFADSALLARWELV